MQPIPHIDAFVSPDHDLIHTSRIFTGLSALARRNAIRLRYRVPPAADRWLVGDPIVICLDVEAAGTCQRVAIDLRDGLGVSRPILDRVDRYFKRAYYAPELADLSPSLAVRIEPFGLNYGCRSVASTFDVMAQIGPSLARRGRAVLPRLRPYLATPGPTAFEQDPDVVIEPKVMFQTRLWTRDEVPPDEVEPLNEFRVAMVRALKRAFGSRFVGGVVPTPLALAQYRADVTPHSSRYVEYLALKKRCLVSVYTRGVEHSLAFKLGETIAASQCLVSVPLRYTLPAPLIEGHNYLSFDTTEEAVSACQRLLDDPALAQYMRHANHEYYVREVEPAAHIANVLGRLQALEPRRVRVLEPESAGLAAVKRHE
jgi:hypothetical protein